MSHLEMEVLGIPKRTPLGWVEGYLQRQGYGFVRTTPINHVGVNNLADRYELLGPPEEVDYYFIQGPPENRVLLQQALDKTAYRLLGPVMPEVTVEPLD